MLAVILTDLGLLVTGVGLVSVLRPLRFAGIRTRPRGAAVAAAGALLTALALLLPARVRAVQHRRAELDRAVPTYQFNEAHSVTVHAPPARVYRAVKEVTADEILLFRTLIWIRRFGRPLPESILNAPGHRPLLDVATETTFTTLTDTPREVVVGTIVIPAAQPGATPPLTPEAFLAMRSRPRTALAAMNFAIESMADGSCVLSTETRVYATDDWARRRFAAYWRIIYPGSAFIRRMWLRAIRARAEQTPSAP